MDERFPIVDSLIAVPICDRLEDALNGDNIVELSGPWHIAVCDVRGSTQAIKSGKYKEVNAIAVAFITALKNEIGGSDQAFIFGGDGAAVIVPDSHAERVMSAMQAVATIATASFQLELRVGLVPLADIKAKGASLRLARYRASPHFNPFVFTGGGIEAAETLLKEGRVRVATGDKTEKVTLDGFECRWQKIPASSDETVAWIFKTHAPDPLAQLETYTRILATAQDIYGPSERSHPLTLANLKLTLNSRLLRPEWKIRGFGLPWFLQPLYYMSLRVQCLLGKVIMRYGLRFAGADWGRYKPDLIANSDISKVDDCLRFIVSGTEADRTKLERILSELFTPEQMNWGYSVSDAAFITCMITAYEGDHIHFIDGADGGYTAAATMLKAKLRLANPAPTA